MAAVDVGIVITQFGRHELTMNCLQTLQAHHDLEAVRILVVDDASPGTDSRRDLQQLVIPFEVLALPSNGGITAAWNAAANVLMKHHAPASLIFLNNDVVIEGNWISQLIAPLHSESTRCTGVRWREEQGVPIHELSLPTTQFIEGWCMAVDSDTFLRLGGFDQQMQLYFSDTDFQCRLLMQFSTVENGPLAVVENLPIQHLEHQTTKSASNRNSLWQQDRKIFIHKWRRIPFI
ncbi:MAG: glycosyltransferase family 2 protein [Planctomycetaceae bacterium]|nr:glycosyltransferase family 2 protein [Planctomycetaceae bacterium]MCA9044736.1 glycosyltransferase family 2 protein [Planctomycetaceae bacterium]